MTETISTIVMILTIVTATALAITIRQQRLIRKRQRQVQDQIEASDQRRINIWREECIALAESLMQREARGFRFPIEWKSSAAEDCFMWMILGRPTTGTFVEVGAHDGYRGSNTYALEAMGWTGVLIEPIPDAFQKCKACRPGSAVVQAACSRKGSSGQTTFAYVAGSEQEEQMSFLTGSGGEGPHRRTLRTRAKLIEQITVPLSTMDAVLTPHLQRLDVAVIDVEGGEADLLDGFSLSTFRPKILLIEDRYPPPIGDVRTKPYIDGAGYVYVTHLGLNNLFVHKDEPEVLAAARRLALTF